MDTIYNTDQKLLNYERRKKNRTLYNWKKQHGLVIPLHKFEQFKSNKKFYLKLVNGELDMELIELLKPKN